MSDMQSKPMGSEQRSLLQILKKYEPGMRNREILSGAFSHTVRADKQKRMLEISAHFSMRTQT